MKLNESFPRKEVQRQMPSREQKREAKLEVAIGVNKVFELETPRSDVKMNPCV